MGKIYPSQEGRKSLGPEHTNHVTKRKPPPQEETGEVLQCRYRNPLTDVRCDKKARSGTAYCPNHHAI